MKPNNDRIVYVVVTCGKKEIKFASLDKEMAQKNCAEGYDKVEARVYDMNEEYERVLSKISVLDKFFLFPDKPRRPREAADPKSEKCD